MFSTENDKIKAIAHYNLMLNAETTKQATEETKSNAGTCTFSDSEYWELGENVINLDNLENHIQPYILKYEDFLEYLGSNELEVRIARFSEVYNDKLNDVVNQLKRNGDFWLCSERVRYGTQRDGIWLVYSGGHSSGSIDETYGIRPIIVFDRN